MMKHVKKKFIVRTQMTAEAVEVVDKHTSTEEDKAFVKELVKSNQYNAYIQTTDGELFQAFKYKFENNTYLIPEMDASILYFEMGRTFLKRTRESKKIFLASIKQQPNLPLESANCFFHVFAHASICIPFLHTSVECFINNHIPNDYEYVEVNKREKKETWNKAAIQFDISYENKIKFVMPDISKQKYHELFQQNYNYLMALKNLRDDIMHTKADVKTPNLYEALYIRILDFNFNEAIEAVKHYINFHRPNWVEPCDCGKDDND